MSVKKEKIDVNVCNKCGKELDQANPIKIYPPNFEKTRVVCYYCGREEFAYPPYKDKVLRIVEREKKKELDKKFQK